MTSPRSRPLPSRSLSPTIKRPDGDPAVLIDAVPVAQGQRVTVSFESVGPRWRQGVFLATAGHLAVNGFTGSSVLLWSDTAPSNVTVDVEETDGRLVVYNVWDSGRGCGRHESQSATSGMVVEELAAGSYRYSCTDIGSEPDFTRLVFRLTIA